MRRLWRWLQAVVRRLERRPGQPVTFEMVFRETLRESDCVSIRVGALERGWRRDAPASFGIE